MLAMSCLSPSPPSHPTHVPAAPFLSFAVYAGVFQEKCVCSFECVLQDGQTGFDCPVPWSIKLLSQVTILAFFP